MHALSLLVACTLIAGALSATCDVVSVCGAIADNSTNAAPSLTACVHAGGPCSSPNSMLVFPTNAIFLSGSIDLSNTTNLTLSFLPGSGIYGSSDMDLYPLQGMLPPTNVPQLAQQWTALIYARNVSGLTLEGDGVIDGLGWPWWKNATTLIHQRPKLVEIIDGDRVTFRGLTFRNSPFWTLHTIYCRDVAFLGLTITAPRSVGNTDGIDPDSCSDVLIQDCVIDVGDDAISLKSDFRIDPSTGVVKLLPTERVVIRNTTVLWRNIALGSSTFGNITDVLVDGGRIAADNDTLPTRWAFKIKTHIPFGGHVSNVTIRGTQIGTVNGTAMYLQLSPYNNPVFPANGPTPAASNFSDIFFIDIHGLRARTAGIFYANSPFYIDRVTMSNVTFQNLTRSTWECSRLSGTIAKDVTPPLPPACY